MKIMPLALLAIYPRMDTPLTLASQRLVHHTLQFVQIRVIRGQPCEL
jgi:hypothetical protein